MTKHIEVPPNERVPLAELDDSDLVDEADACRILGGERSPINKLTLRRGVERGLFPPPFYLGLRGQPRLKRWRVGALRAVIADREAA